MSGEIHYWRYGLRLKHRGGANAASGRGVLEGMLIRVDGGYGCVHPWPELGDDSLRVCWERLRGDRAGRCRVVDRALECARLDGAARRAGKSLFEGLQVPVSHATFPGPGSREDFLQLKSEGFQTVKLKGGRNWRTVLNSMIEARAAGLRLRVDFNGLLSAGEFLEFTAAVAALPEGGELRAAVDFVEDPVPYNAGVWRQLAAASGWRLALDWLPENATEAGGFDVRVIKPATVPVAGPEALPLVITSAMDHPLGQLFAAYEAARFEGRQWEAGLLTHRLFEKNAFTEALGEAGPELRLPGGTGLGFDKLLEALPWLPVLRRGQRGKAGEVLQNPRDPLAAGLPPLKEGELGFPTSGSTGWPSVMVHDDASLEASARAVNHWLEAGSEDVWLRVLPLFHVGGRQIHTRAELSGSRVVEGKGKWEAADFAELCGREGVTLASLVPTQVFDLVAAGLKAPPCLRAVMVGGGALEEALWRQARDLGWPLLPSYGSTETASMVAAGPLSGLDEREMPPLELLPGWEARVGAEGKGKEEGRLELRGQGLAAARLVFDGSVWERFGLLPAGEPVAGWWRTADQVILQGRRLRFAGRSDRVVKVLGELVNLAAVERGLLEAGLTPGSFAVIAQPDERRGHVLVLFTETGIPAEVSARYELKAAPFARLGRVVRVVELPRSALGKVRYGELAALIPPAVPG